jgi:hypothetical protein
MEAPAPTLSERIDAIIRPLGMALWFLILLFFAVCATCKAFGSTLDVLHGKPGVNYYLHEPGRVEPLLLGNQRDGWCFVLNTIAELGLNTWEEWKKRLLAPGVTLTHSGGEWPIYATDIVEFIHARRQGHGSTRPAEWRERNRAHPGPNRLARFTIGGLCLSNEATYDLVRV